MNFKFEDLGPIRSGDIDIKDLTIICGENNTGKTYISYTLYGFYKWFDSCFKNNIDANKYIEKISNEKSYNINLEQLFNDIDNIRIKALEDYKRRIPKVFNTGKESFKNLKIEVDFSEKYINKEEFFEEYEETFKRYAEVLNKKIIISRENDYLRVTDFEGDEEDEILGDEDLLKLLMQLSVPNKISITKNDVFMLPAERSGINIFFKELNINRNNEIFALNEGVKMKNFIRKMSKYSLPISDYINFLNNMGEKNEVKPIFEEPTNYLENDVIGGKYSIDKDNNIRFFHKDFKKNESISFHIASSTAKTLFSLDYYLKYNAVKGDVLIIDEPELNLHPDNQRKLTRLLAQIVNKGIKLIISTHSDYIIKEINNLIILGRKFEGYQEIMKKYNYKENELIDENKVGAYILNNKIIKNALIDIEGIVIDTFDDVINAYNESSDEIYYKYEGCLQDE